MRPGSPPPRTGTVRLTLDCRPADPGHGVRLRSGNRSLSEGPQRRRSALDRERYERGLRIRSDVLGEQYVNRALADADEFTRPLQDLVTEYCWGAVWGREELPRKTRSMLNLAMIAVLNRPNELRMHIKAALTNGVTREEIREVFLQVAIYAGVPAAVDSFRIAREAFAELDRENS
ncbi:hypothetical protein MAP_0745c [Mycobacterium avium subsp. paratuberculosis K-10]|uniref:Carboxymuconolactone decarboxylase-like domain-containing protein n=1 Tax=Mycolicibacterium paratuberculosis (strain ATCC BAA-968 / K-10) TaxID=262316 RepID=Q742U0_MYCPA|nr:hypothetical protein MAP_0745c [Mycobacterium avium subsp. paratuberculosis K-10]